MTKGKLYEEIWMCIEDLTVTQLLDEAKKAFPKWNKRNDPAGNWWKEEASSWFNDWFGSEDDEDDK